MGEPSVTKQIKALDVAINDYSQMETDGLEHAKWIVQAFRKAIATLKNDDDQFHSKLKQLQELNNRLRAINENRYSHFLHRNGLSMPQSNT